MKRRVALRPLKVEHEFTDTWMTGFEGGGPDLPTPLADPYQGTKVDNCVRDWDRLDSLTKSEAIAFDTYTNLARDTR